VRLAATARLEVLFEPLVQHVVKVDVGEDG
jgi:hypothetical protein